MRLSIVIPTLNEAANIAKAIGAAWELRPKEVIVADGGSTDGTVEAARELPCVLVKSPPGRGIQLNAGAAAATGDLLLFLHADNWLEPCTRSQLESALSNPAVVGGAFRQRIEARGLVFRGLEWGNAQRVVWWGMAYGDQGIFVRQEVFARLGGFSDVPLMEDVIFMSALRRLARPALLPGPLHVSPRRWQRHGVLQQTLRNWATLLAFRCGISPATLARYYAPPREVGVHKADERRVNV